MERKIGKFREAEVAESFTFSSLDLNSSTELFSDEESDYDDHENEETYIEIALEPPLDTIPLGLGNPKEEGEENNSSSTAAGNDQEFEFSTSLSSQVSFPGIGFSSSYSSPTFCSYSTTCTCSSSITAASNSSESSASASASASADGGYTIKAPAEPLVVPPPDGGSNFSRIHTNIINNSDHNKRKVQLPLPTLHSHRLFKAFLSAFKPSSSSVAIIEENARPDDHDNLDQMAHETMYSWVRPVKSSRKTSKDVTSEVISNAGVVMKLLIKFQSTSIRILSTVTSFLKSQSHQVNISPSTTASARTSTSRVSNNYGRLLMKPFEKWSARRGRDPPSSDNSFGNGERWCRSSRLMLDHFNLDALRGKLDCLRMNIGHKRKQTKSFRSSTNKSSPNPFLPPPTPSAKTIYTRDNSVQAAIAHCKK